MKSLGVEYPAQSKIVQDRMKSTCLKNNGTEHPLQSKKIHVKMLLRNNELYGVDYPIQLDVFKQKMKKTWISNHGNIGFGSNLVKQSIKDTYNVENVSQLEQVKIKVKEKCLKKWGVDNYAKTDEFHKKCHKRYTNPKYPDMTFGSSWEFLVYDFLLENHIDFEYQPAISLPYEYMETHHTYHPDFRIGDKIVEVKGDNFFRINESTGNDEMFCPYRDEDWSDEKYDWMCGLYEAKHQCMIANNVIILRENDVKNLSLQIFDIEV